ADLKHLLKFRELVTLAIWETDLTDEGLKEIVKVTWLRELNLHATQITDAGLAMVAQLKQLYSLGLMRTGISDDGLAHLSGMKTMTMLSLGETSIGNEGMVLACYPRNRPEVMRVSGPKEKPRRQRRWRSRVGNDTERSRLFESFGMPTRC